MSIVDVARAAKVSTATVSRSLTRPDLVAEQTRSRVMRAVERTGYTPNQAARALITGRTGHLAVVVPDIVNPFFAQVVRGVQLAVRPHDRHVLLIDTTENPAEELAATRSIAPQVDTVVLVAPRLVHRHLDALAGRPAVFVNRAVAGYPSVLIRSSRAMQDAFRHLAEQGHRAVAYLGGPARSWSAQERLRVARSMARRLQLDLTTYAPNEPLFDAGAALADRLLAGGPTAVIAFNDQMALGVISRLRELGAAVPGRMSVVGCDDVPMAAHASPALTTLALPAHEAGAAAGELALQAGKPGRTGPVLEAKLVIRDSTGPAPRRR